MKKQFILNSGAVVAAAVMIALGAQSMDKAGAAGSLAAVNGVAVDAKANVVAAVASGNVDAMAEAQKRADAVDAAVAQAQDAYNSFMNAPDSASAEAAANSLAAAVATANKAIVGDFSVEAPKAVAAKKAKNTGGPGYPNDLPNIYYKPAETALQGAVMHGVFCNFWATSAFGTRSGFGDLEATPE